MPFAKSVAPLRCAGAARREADRLAALAAYHVLDTPPEPAFDRSAQLAADICDAPMALVSLIDERRQWFKARVGINVPETPRELAFCAHAILQSDPLVVPDATRDPRFADNALVTGPTHLRFYAGAPLVTPAGHRLGTLCVLGTEAWPNGLTSRQLRALIALASQVVSELELRRTRRELADNVFELR
jgi:GAF domain-containing protein